jgi:hypothetical protein
MLIDAKDSENDMVISMSAFLPSSFSSIFFFQAFPAIS